MVVYVTVQVDQVEPDANIGLLVARVEEAVQEAFKYNDVSADEWEVA